VRWRIKVECSRTRRTKLENSALLQSMPGAEMGSPPGPRHKLQRIMHGKADLMSRDLPKWIQYSG
jgi:hypothetical protein